MLIYRDWAPDKALAAPKKWKSNEWEHLQWWRRRTETICVSPLRNKQKEFLAHQSLIGVIAPRQILTLRNHQYDFSCTSLPTARIWSVNQQKINYKL